MITPILRFRSGAINYSFPYDYTSRQRNAYNVCLHIKIKKEQT